MINVLGTVLLSVAGLFVIIMLMIAIYDWCTRNWNSCSTYEEI